MCWGFATDIFTGKAEFAVQSLDLVAEFLLNGRMDEAVLLRIVRAQAALFQEFSDNLGLFGLVLHPVAFFGQFLVFGGQGPDRLPAGPPRLLAWPVVANSSTERLGGFSP